MNFTVLTDRDAAIINARMEFGPQPKFQQEFDSLAAATAASTKFKMQYPGPYDSTVGIYPLPEGKYLVLGHWNAVD